MKRSNRVWIIYRKELLEILRDRRTLTAMVVIPVVLYPMLMLGFLRAAENEEAKLRTKTFVVEVADEPTAEKLRALIRGVVEDWGGDGETGAQASRPQEQLRPQFEVRAGDTPMKQLGDDVQLRMTLESLPPPEGTVGPAKIRLHVIYNEVNINSRSAKEAMLDLLSDFRRIAVRERVETALKHARPRPAAPPMDVESILDPVKIETVSVATERQRGGWALGQIIPVILVLMTITGSIYPAVDLTAGERERGTLETLMVTPVPTVHLILGKFLAVASLGMLTALLNVASVGATMHFSGLTQSITEQMPVELPIEVLPIILLCMVPFALLFAAILVAVCSFARTFKEAQSYVMPVILAALIPAMAVTLPTARLGGVLLVLPVGNMVLLARELFQGSYTWAQVAIVLVSTSLYAAAALAVAVRLFGQEAVAFADSGSYKTLILRRFFRPTSRPTVSQALLFAALLFPACFYAQSLLGTSSPERFIDTLVMLAVVQFTGLFVLLPLGVTLYYKIDPVATFRLRLPPLRAWVAAVLLGVSSWAVAQQVVALQARVLPPSQALQEAFKQIEAQLATVPLWQVLVLMAIVPAIAEELFFRGFLLSGLLQGMRKWPAILITGATFGIFHFMIDRVPITAMLGVVLAYVCWQSRSIWPCMLIHAMHNGLLMIINAVSPETVERLGIPETAAGLLPARVFVPAVVLFAAGLAIAASIRQDKIHHRDTEAQRKD